MNDPLYALLGVLLPFFGTALGAFSVFVLKGAPNDKLKKIFFGFAAGVMLAASVWSLLIPAMETSGGAFSAAVGLLSGTGIFLLGDVALSRAGKKKSGEQAGGKLMALAVTLHNIPEGMAVGVVFAGVLQSSPPLSLAPAFVLSLGIAIQNFPEGAIISMPLASLGTPKGRAFLLGVLSGAVEPLGALLALFLTRHISAILPYVLSFAAGAMLYVTVEELIPALSKGGESKAGCMSLAAGFTLMMILDVVLGG